VASFLVFRVCVFHPHGIHEDGERCLFWVLTDCLRVLGLDCCTSKKRRRNDGNDFINHSLLLHSSFKFFFFIFYFPLSFLFDALLRTLRAFERCHLLRLFWFSTGAVSNGPSCCVYIVCNIPLSSCFVITSSSSHLSQPELKVKVIGRTKLWSDRRN
jgi:hypothetical protein